MKQTRKKHGAAQPKAKGSALVLATDVRAIMAWRRFHLGRGEQHIGARNLQRTLITVRGPPERSAGLKTLTYEQNSNALRSAGATFSFRHAPGSRRQSGARYSTARIATTIAIT